VALAIPIYMMKNRAKLHWNLSIKYGDVTAREIGVKGRKQMDAQRTASRHTRKHIPSTEDTVIGTTLIDHPGWQWANHPGQKMINKVASTIHVGLRVQCMINCTLSPSCDSYNYRPSDKTCQLNTHDTPLIANSTDMVTDSAWTWWSPVFCTLV